MQPNMNYLEPWMYEQLAKLGSRAPFGPNGRVMLGLAFDGWFLPKEMIADLFKKAKDAGAQLITTHCGVGPQWMKDSPIQMMSSYGVLDSSMLISHANGATPKDAKLVREAGAHIVSTPSTEMQMAIGRVVCFDDTVKEMAPQCSLGCDLHTNNSPYMPGEMRVGLQGARAEFNQKLWDEWKAPKMAHKTVEQAFNLGTIMGARACKMEDQVGSLKVGKKADLVVFDAVSPGMVCCADNDPVAAVVLNSSVRDVDMVLVDGAIRKKAGKLLPVDVDEAAASLASKKSLEWAEVAKKLVETQKEILQRVDKVDIGAERKNMLQLFQLDEKVFVDV